jgi:TerC family integral membrane protein
MYGSIVDAINISLSGTAARPLNTQVDLGTAVVYELVGRSENPQVCAMEVRNQTLRCECKMSRLIPRTIFLYAIALSAIDAFSVPLHVSTSFQRKVPLSLAVRRNMNSDSVSHGSRERIRHLSLSASKGNDNIGGGAIEGSSSAAATAFGSSAEDNAFVAIVEDNYSYNEAIQRTLAWVVTAILFGGGLWAVAGPQTGQEFFAGYLVEQSLSVDNLFVFLLLFEYFKVPLQFQDRVLNWGIYGAIMMRAVMIGIGAAALQKFHAILLVFASILVYSSASFFLNVGKEEEEDPEQNTIVRFSRSLIPSTDNFDGDRFFTIVDGVRTATPLFICMIAVEISDVVFAVDSIPAVFGVTEVTTPPGMLILTLPFVSLDPCLRQ